ncbi:hypothetical protein JCM8202v2_000167 [Rhodotorula sphaerocarpa]
MTLDAWVSADHSLTADSRSLSLARVEDWRAMVDASQEQENPVEYDMEATPKPAKGRLRRGKGTEISSPEPAPPLRIPRRTKELQAADPKSARADPSCKDPPSAGPRRKGSAEPDGSLRSDRRFGRERTNETASTASAGEEEDKRPGAKAKATRASRGEAGQAGRAGRAKRAVALEVGSDSEGDREARKEQARAKWQAIDDYALDTVYTL